MIPGRAAAAVQPFEIAPCATGTRRTSKGAPANAAGRHPLMARNLA